MSVDSILETIEKKSNLLSTIYIILIILFSSSFSTLEPLQMGIARNNIASSVDKDKVYMGGRYFLGLGKEFVIYPTTAQTIEMFNVQAATKDKQSVYLDLAFQYKLTPSKLVDLYSERQQGYDSFYRREVEEDIKEVTVLWNTIPDFYEKRVQIASDMKDKVQTMLAINSAELVSFQLRSIGLLQATETKIIETLVSEQEELTEQIIQQTTVVRAEKEEYATAAAAEVKVINSEANAKGIAISADSEAKAFKLVTDAQSSKLAKIEEGLGLGSPGKLLTYMWYTGLGLNSEKTKLIVNPDAVSQSKLT
ncbi:hypothetical protein TL16_g01575 [Triparma laevis f. inornata]|uniref:Band 7 domain-containing protein n=1 Tax=Triparma laevis f. inornata TaxID=1714386 RepID=A0A9W7DT06_9STRA|nr:hypothetical protein TL16_g01575 [Triparma laevis f. inornata]